MAGIASAVYGLAALAYGFISFRSRHHQASSHAATGGFIGRTVPPGGLLLGLWRMPEASRTFDMTLASLLALELSVMAVLGWRQQCRPAAGSHQESRREPSAVAVVGTLFAASILVAALTTVGMAASTAGDLAVPHSGHSDTANSPSVPSNIEHLKNQGHHH